ncbi:(2Fe-2S)-binding protein [Acidobacteria bacterium AH-259-D05]|nr:(2Fe-2S)-binding protein [Acidobacteria bacterium AH-259-D05]
MKPITRRLFLERSGRGVAVATAIPALEVPLPQLKPDPSAPAQVRTQVHLKVNGEDHRLEVEDRWTLAEVLRDHLGLTGTRLGCDRGECGSCTVLLDGKSLYSCSYLAVWADGQEITTVEGLAHGDELDALQEAFITHDGPQCGFCTSGQLMSARELLNENPNPTEKEARQALAGNICRCSNFNRYLEAILAAGREEVSRG